MSERLTEEKPATRLWRIALWLLKIAPLFGMASALISSLTTVMAFLAWSVFTRYEADIWEYVRSASGITELEAQVRSLAGEDRVIQIEAGSAYAIEPVKVGGTVTLRFTIRRTRLGATCRIEDAVPVFKDDRNIPMPGVVLSPLQQFGRDWVNAQSIIQLPADLIPGRNRVELQLSYNCSGVIVPDRIPPIAFTLLGG
jgi:hypothetical protein